MAVYQLEAGTQALTSQSFATGAWSATILYLDWMDPSQPPSQSLAWRIGNEKLWLEKLDGSAWEPVVQLYAPDRVDYEILEDGTYRLRREGPFEDWRKNWKQWPTLAQVFSQYATDLLTRIMQEDLPAGFYVPAL